MSGLLDRVIGAARLDVKTYEEVEHDKEATPQAAGIVIASALATGIGTLGYGGGIGSVIGGTLAGLLGWVIWAGVIYLIGTKLLPESQTDADMGQLLRTLGYAQAPGILRIFGFIPVLGALIHLAVGIWLIATTVVAVRQALDYTSTGRAVGVVVLGFLAYLLVFGLLFSAMGGGAATPVG